MPRTICAVIFLLCLLLASPPLRADALADRLPGAARVGGATFHFWWRAVYDIQLLAPEGRYRPDAPFALSLTYHRTFTGQSIAEESIRQMRAQGWKDETRLEAWYQRMRTIFPDVKQGTVLTGIRDAQGASLFLHGDEVLGRIEDPQFSEAFFGIWLSPGTSEPELREALLGGRP